MGREPQFQGLVRKVLEVAAFLAAMALLVMLATEALKVRRGEGGCVERPIFLRARKITYRVAVLNRKSKV